MFNESIFRKQRKKNQIIRYIFWVKRSCGVRGIFSLNCVLIEFIVLNLNLIFIYKCLKFKKVIHHWKLGLNVAWYQNK